jgi:hypothetical protein
MLRSLGLFAASMLIAALASFVPTKEASASGAVTFFVVLNGSSECNGATPPVCHQGDPDGYGAATILLVASPTPTVCFGIVTDNLAQSISGAHIHIGATGINGGIKVNLTPAGMPTGDPRGWGSCVTAGVTSQLINQIKANPQNYYVNVHTTGAGGFTAGAIRGQLF